MAELDLQDRTESDLLGFVNPTGPAAPTQGREAADVHGPESGAVDLLPPLSPVVLGGLVRLLEFVLVAASGALVHLVYVGWEADAAWTYGSAVPLISAAAVIAFQIVELYTPAAFRTFAAQAGRLAAAWGAVFTVVLVILFLAKLGDDFSRVWIAFWYAGGLALLLAERFALSRLVSGWFQSGRLERRAVIVGGGESAETLIRALEASPETDIRICGIFDDRGDDRSPPVQAGHRKLGTVDDLIAFARRRRVDLLIVSLPITAETRLLQMLKKLWVLPVDIRLSAHTNKLRFRPRSYSYIGDVPMLDVADRPLADWNFVSKWLFDRIVGGLLLLAFAPLMSLVAVAIKLDSPGPVLFRQRRYGFNNELIEVLKYRSMHVEHTDPAAGQLVTRNDPRVTRVGRFIRRTSLDELPQLINVVLHGNLSLVGPRPHAVQAKAADRLYGEVVDGYFARHRVKPGITGWAQVNGWRGETDTPEKIQRRVEHDLYYIENWSILFDLYILARTPVSLLGSERAY